jgi:small subunit ribosomal protein S17
MAKVLIGIVSSSKSDKTITVITHGRRTHPIYKKQYPVSKKFLVHDEKNEANVGDKVSFVETRPISARKRFKLETIIEKPKLREDSLAVTREDDAAKRPDSKKKSEDEEAKGVKEAKVAPSPKEDKKVKEEKK